MRRAILAVVLPLLVALAGCASVPQVPYDRMTAGEIKTIGVVTPKFPNRATVILATTVGQSFGLVGALVDAAIQDGRDSSFDKMVKAQNFVAQEAVMQRLSETLHPRLHGVHYFRHAKRRQFHGEVPDGTDGCVS